MAKQLGLIGTDEDGLIKDFYGNVVLFSSKENAVMAGAKNVYPVVKAKKPTKKEEVTNSPFIRFAPDQIVHIRLGDSRKNF